MFRGSQHFPWHNYFGGVWNHLRCSNWRCCYHKGVPEKFGDAGCRFLRVSMFCSSKVLFDVRPEGCVFGCIGTRRQVCLWHRKGSQWHSGAVKNACQILIGPSHVLRLSWVLTGWSLLKPNLLPTPYTASVNSFTSLKDFFASILAKTGLGNANTADINGGLPSDISSFAIYSDLDVWLGFV